MVGLDDQPFRIAANKRLRDALHLQALAALNVSPGARGYYDHRARAATHSRPTRTVARPATTRSQQLHAVAAGHQVIGTV